MAPRKKPMLKNTDDGYVICPSCPEETLLYPAICFKPHPSGKDVWYFYEPGSVPPEILQRAKLATSTILSPLPSDSSSSSLAGSDSAPSGNQSCLDIPVLVDLYVFGYILIIRSILHVLAFAVLVGDEYVMHDVVIAVVPTAHCNERLYAY
ncbi:hypothetical protein CONPUDRAFT_160365 [Coniophora puteana RWD-64-598 SS2]|uniref:Uncharacterized protein n=1 Tax=Coniophora puteana (strain RWD-64-598) TaxID=741705 RepID=R7SD60_CONPW|nr:uncharacterized protein CONPUDRAFT_160365 [Coniophora puteana RWD-64-598 SS2]EIW74111.1 hypothetical protein CONPUDRAFT_160365 [Coniophora puteana RWD-64-598 SS2]